MVIYPWLAKSSFEPPMYCIGDVLFTATHPERALCLFKLCANDNRESTALLRESGGALHRAAPRRARSCFSGGRAINRRLCQRKNRCGMRH
jgi:hypothetical protein